MATAIRFWTSIFLLCVSSVFDKWEGKEGDKIKNKIKQCLCLGTENIPDNVGMKNQVALLKRVQKNCHFRRQSKINDITIGGVIAGSISVDLLTTSKSAEGLFHKAISESGLSSSTFLSQTYFSQNAKDHAKTKNFTNVDNIYQLEVELVVYVYRRHVFFFI